jgi:hypothetical protein
VAGTGKSLLVDLASAIATGREAGVIAQGKDETETEKRLGAILRYGDPVLALDNCEQPIGGDFLCQLLTQDVVRVRILGLSEAPELPTTTMVFATGNNLAVSGDMSRRTLMCFLDPQVERPELRIFDSNPVQTVRRDRGRYVHASLTIGRAYRQAADAPRPTPLGSFEDWSNTIRGAVLWLGMADPVETMERVRGSDPQLDELVAVLTHWDSAIGSDRTTVSGLIKVANQKGDYTDFGSTRDLRHEELHEALLAVAGAGGVINGRRLGKWLSAKKGRIVGGRFIEQLGLYDGVMQWRLSRKK